jgi:hypothetical protein
VSYQVTVIRDIGIEGEGPNLLSGGPQMIHYQPYLLQACLSGILSVSLEHDKYDIFV